MEKEQEAIEVEVVAIDGVAPVPASTPHQEGRKSTAKGWQDWQKWQGRVRTLDPRWWPLWLFLGIILVFLLLTFGVVFGIVYLIYRIIRNFLLGIANSFR